MLLIHSDSQPKANLFPNIGHQQTQHDAIAMPQVIHAMPEGKNVIQQFLFSLTLETSGFALLQRDGPHLAPVRSYCRRNWLLTQCKSSSQRKSDPTLCKKKHRGKTCTTRSNMCKSVFFVTVPLQHVSLNSFDEDRSQCVPPSTCNSGHTLAIIHCHLHWQVSVVAVTQTQLHRPGK